MRKLVLLLLIMMVASLNIAQDDTVSLAQYFPENTSVFATMRVDSGTFETIDGLLAAIDRNANGALPPEFSSETLLDMAALSLGVNFNRDVRPWLGKTVAIGITDIAVVFETSGPGEPGVLVVAELTDSAGAITFFSQMTGKEPVDFNGHALFDMGTARLVITDEVLLLTNDNIDTLMAQARSLADDADYMRVMDGMPEENYYIKVYLNSNTLFTSLEPLIYTQISPELREQYSQALQAGGAVAFGITLKERSVVLDAFGISDPLAGMPVMMSQAVDPAFMANVPYPAALVVHGNGFGTTLLSIFDGLDQMGPILQDQMVPSLLMGIESTMPMSGPPPAGSPEAVSQDIAFKLINDIDLSVIKFGGIIKHSITPFVAGITGLNLENDILSWMSGDYALAVSVLAAENEMGFTADTAFMTEASDAAKAAYIVERLTEVAGLYNIPHETQLIGDVPALVYTELIPSLFPQPQRDALIQAGQFRYLVAANDELFVSGTQSSVAFALGEGDRSLLDNPAYVFAQDNLFLDDAHMIIYIGVNSISELVNSGPITDNRMAQAGFFLSQVESITLSSNSNNAGGQGLRLTITIPAGS